MTLIFRIGQGVRRYEFWLRKQPLPRLWMAATICHWGYPRWTAKNRWPSVEAHFNVLSSQDLLPSIIAFMIVWIEWLPFSLIRTWLNGDVKPSMILALVALIRLKFIHLAKYCILPTIPLFINQLSHATAQYSPIILHYMKFLVKLHNELGENTLTHSGRLFLDPIIPPRFHYIDCHQCLFSLLLWPTYRPNQSGNIRCGRYIALLRGFWILTAVVQFHIWFIVCLPVVFAVIWIIQVLIPVKPIFGVWNAFRWTILVTFRRMALDLFDLVDIQYSSSSSREVLRRPSWWHRWFFWRFECSRTIMLKVWPRCFENLFSIWNVSYGCHLIIFSTTFLLCSS